MKEILPKPSHLVELAGVVLLFGISKILGLDLASRFGGWLGAQMSSRIGRSRLAKANLASAMPELQSKEIDSIVDHMWRNVGRTFLEYAHLAKFSKPRHRWRVEIDFSQKAHDALRAHQGRAIFFSGHFTNWELLPLPLRRDNIPSAEIYQKLSNHYVNFLVKRLRSRAILPHQVPKGGSVRNIIHHIRSNHAFAVLVDQKMIEGVHVKFFNRPAATSEFPAVMALKYDYALIPAYIVRADRGWRTAFRLFVCDPLEVDRSSKDAKNIRAVTQQVNDFLEARIRAKPDHWLWFHHRWTSRGRRARPAGS